MNGISCGKCSLINPESADVCRRCGKGLHRFERPRSVPSPRDAAKKPSSWIYTLLFVTLLGGGAYYLYTGFRESYDHVQQSEASRTKSPANRQSEPFQSRTDTEQKRVQPFKNAIANSPGLAEVDKHNAEAEKLMQPAR